MTLLLLVLSAFLIYKKQTAIPESLIAFGEKYPEAAGFVTDYPKEKYKKHTIDLSDEVSAGTIPLFLQWDKRWGYETYGNNCIGTSGCGPTCLSMVVCGLTGETAWNPYEVAKFSENQGYYVPDMGTSWDLMTAGAEALGLSAASGEVQAEYITRNLMEQIPVICSMRPGDFTYTGHFIVLTGIDPEGKIIVNDPNSRINSEKLWEMDVLLPQIKALWTYDLQQK